MFTMRTAVFSFLMISALALGTMGIYSASATSGEAAFDGYGVTSAVR